MGVSMNQYLVAGVLLPYDIPGVPEEVREAEWDKYHDSGYQEEITSHNGLTMISDGMGGEFRFIGLILKKAPIHQALESVFDIPRLTNHEEQMLRALLWLNFGQHIPGIEDKDIKVMLLTHYH